MEEVSKNYIVLNKVYPSLVARSFSHENSNLIKIVFEVFELKKKYRNFLHTFYK